MIVTHSHPDHFGGAGRLRKEAGAELIAHQAFTTWSLRAAAARRSPRREAERLEQQAIDEAAHYHGPSARRAADPRRRRRTIALDEITTETQRQSVPVGRHHAVGRQQAPAAAAQAPDDDPRHAAAVRAAATRRGACATGRRSGSPAATGSRSTRRATRSTTSASTTRSTACCSRATTCCRRSRRTSPASGQGDALNSYLATLDLVAALDGVQLGLPAHGHPFDDVPGRVEAIKEHHFERMEKLRDASLAIGPADVVRAVARGVPRAALGRHGRERDVRPPRAPAPLRRGRALGRRTACLDVYRAAPRPSR